MKLLEELMVFPSEEPTIRVFNEDDTYGGAHFYKITNCAGFEIGTYYDVKDFVKLKI